ERPDRRGPRLPLDRVERVHPRLREQAPHRQGLARTRVLRECRLRRLLHLELLPPPRRRIAKSWGGDGSARVGWNACRGRGTTAYFTVRDTSDRRLDPSASAARYSWCERRSPADPTLAWGGGGVVCARPHGGRAAGARRAHLQDRHAARP